MSEEEDDDLDGAWEARTNNIVVRVRTFFLEDESAPEENRYVWAYKVAVENHGRFTVQLLRRSWEITDGLGRTKHVHGEGVVGEQPVLKPGQAFEYVSGTPLATPSGFMTGSYHLIEKPSGQAFDVAIPAFSLDSPHADGRVH